ncbi:hypothetical protein [Marinoscillum sp. MHG1-6]|uniref:hypothetical protein n=1 Tax=Marinoscillum sp. MHG1-6 TaxID=2959627 RepID=UPI0021576DF4|nr:hypothetical protein [Marinoscillum sp. MHG1-6]
MIKNLFQNHTAKLLAAFLIAISFISQAQPKDIKGAFDEIMKEHATWEIYKVVPVTKLEGFGKALGDTIATKERTISSLRTEVKELNVLLDSTNVTVASLRTNLNSSEALNDQIIFMGVEFTKIAYNVLVWTIVLALVGLLAFTYYLFKRSHVITRSARKELEEVKLKLDVQKEKAREREVKIKRELQTAMNKLHDNGIQV